VNRSLRYINLLGVLLLTGLCVWQWVINRNLELGRIDLETAVRTKTDSLSKAQRTIEENRSDLDDFRRRVEMSEVQLKDLSVQVRSLTTQRAALMESLDQWKSAVAQRDAVLKTAQEQIHQATTQRDEAIEMYNDLVRQRR
jgi:chromosome segregation ATPase